MSRRDEIKLSDEEQRELLESERVVVVASHGVRGWPHLMPLWYVPRDGRIWVWTYAKSQKVRNLERDARATVLVETGFEYTQLRGVQIEAEAILHRDLDTVFEFAKELTVRYAEGIRGVSAGTQGVPAAAGEAAKPPQVVLECDAAEGLRAQAPKRVAIEFEPKRVATWDHRKLGGVY